MSADGEISVRVNAEGASDAADELAGRGGGGGGGGRGGRGLTGALKGAGFLAILGSALELLGPLADGIDAIFEILKAFLAPIGLIFFRLMAPVLRLLVKILPVWFDFMRTVDGLLVAYIEFFRGLRTELLQSLSGLPARIWSLLDSGWAWLSSGAVNIGQQVWSFISSGASWIANGAANIGQQVWQFIKSGASWIANGASRIAREIWSFLKRLPALIGQEIAARIPELPSAGGVTDAASSTASSIGDRVRDTVNGVSVNLQGGLDAFVDEIESTADVDF